MSQTYTDDCFSGPHVAQTDMANIENNFAALKSCFSGASAPSNTVAGMWWFDTTTNILKVRNEANSAWLSVYDFANQRAFIDGSKVMADIILTAGIGLSGGGALNASRTINHAAHTGDVTGSTVLTIGAEKVLKTMIKTGTGNMAGSLTFESRVDITTQDCCYGANIHTQRAASAVVGNSTDTGTYVHRFGIYGNWDGSDSYDVDYRYNTSSDEPFIYLLQNQKTGKYDHVSICDDPPPGYWGMNRTPEDFKAPIIPPTMDELSEIVLWKQPKELLAEIRDRRTKDKKRIQDVIHKYEPRSKTLKLKNIGMV